MGSPRPPPLRRRGLFRFGTTEAPAAEARGPPSLWIHRGGGLRVPSADVRHCGLGGHDRRVRGWPRARTPSAEVPCAGGGGGPGHGPSPRDPPAKRRPVGSTWRLRAHTRETASPFPWGGGGPCRKWSRRSASPPIPCPWEGIRLRVGRVHARSAGQGTRGGDEEESRRHDA